MKICVFATGRCGSTSLVKLFMEHLPKNYLKVIEPFRLKHTINDISQYENVIIKTLVGQTTKDTPLEVTYNWIGEFFDKIIILDRRDKQKQTESYAYNSSEKNTKGWNIKKYYDMSLISENELNDWKDDLTKFTEILEDFSIKNNKKIYYYEDIFIDNDMSVINEIFEYLNLEINDEILNKWVLSDNQMVRLENKNNNLI